MRVGVPSHSGAADAHDPSVHSSRARRGGQGTGRLGTGDGDRPRRAVSPRGDDSFTRRGAFLHAELGRLAEARALADELLSLADDVVGDEALGLAFVAGRIGRRTELLAKLEAPPRGRPHEWFAQVARDLRSPFYRSVGATRYIREAEVLLAATEPETPTAIAPERRT
jgi:hypothetical protein